MVQAGEVVCDGDVCRFVPSAQGADAAAPDAAASLQKLLGEKLIGKSGPISTSSIAGADKVIALYFR